MGVNNQHSPDTNYKHISGVEGWKMGAKDCEDVEKGEDPIMKKPKFKDDLKKDKDCTPQVYVCMTLITVIALLIVFAKIKVVEAIEGTPDPRISTFKPLKQRVDTDIMYVGIGFLPDDWYYYHSEGRMSDRAYKSIRILDTLRWTGPTDPPKQSSTAAKQIY